MNRERQQSMAGRFISIDFQMINIHTGLYVKRSPEEGNPITERPQLREMVI